jgi:hypothetical protein
MWRFFFVPFLVAACDPGAGGAADLAVVPDLAFVDKAAPCATSFGAALTDAFGRLDGTVRAVVPPGHPTCARPNGTHLVLQVDAGGAAYRMVVNVESNRAGDVRVRLDERSAPLVGAPFAEGWHPGLALDYVTDFAVAQAAFTPYARDELVARISDRLALGAPVAVYATSSGGDSAHLVHRNRAGNDGAIVVDPTSSAPLFLLLAFSDQTF